MDAATWVGVAGLVSALLGGIAGVIAALAKRAEVEDTVEEKAQARDDATNATAQALIASERAALTAEYRALLEDMRRHLEEKDERHVKEISHLDERCRSIETALVESRAHQELCERELSNERLARRDIVARLHQAEARIAELGG